MKELEPKLTDNDVFEHLLRLGHERGDSQGSVTAAIVRDGKILVSATSVLTGVVIHAEHNALGYLSQKGEAVLPTDVLYTTLEPCTGRFDPDIGLRDCTSIILASGIKKVVYGASDPIQTELTHKRFQYGGAILKQVEDPNIIERCRDLFNDFSEEFDGYKV